MTRIVTPPEPEPRPAPVRRVRAVPVEVEQEEAAAWLALVHGLLADHPKARTEVALYIGDGGDPIVTACAVRGVLGEMNLAHVVAEADARAE